MPFKVRINEHDSVEEVSPTPPSTPSPHASGATAKSQLTDKDTNAAPAPAVEEDQNPAVVEMNYRKYVRERGKKKATTDKSNKENVPPVAGSSKVLFPSTPPRNKLVLPLQSPPQIKSKVSGSVITISSDSGEENGEGKNKRKRRGSIHKVYMNGTSATLNLQLEDGMEIVLKCRKIKN